MSDIDFDTSRLESDLKEAYPREEISLGDVEDLLAAYKHNLTLLAEREARIKELEGALRKVAHVMPYLRRTASYASDSDRDFNIKAREAHESVGVALSTKPTSEGDVQEVQASWNRLRERVKTETGEDLGSVTYVQCDRCGGVKPRELIALHSPSGINHCKEECNPKQGGES